MPLLYSRTNRSDENVFSRMNRLAMQHGAINLGQGFPANKPPKFLQEIARSAIGTVDQYAPPLGLPVLREALAEDLNMDASDVLVTTGASEGLMLLALSLYGPGDEVIIVEPCYDVYVPQTEMAGAKMVGVSLSLKEDRFVLEIEQVQQAITAATRAIVINNPHNPTGTVLNSEELQAIAHLARQYDLWIISDEVYDELYYDEPPMPLRWFAPERTFTVGSAGKRLEATGWRVGWIACPPEAKMAEHILAVRQIASFCAPAPLQAAIAKALPMARETGFYAKLRREYRKLKDTLAQGLQSLGASVYQPQGTYFLTAQHPQWNADELVVSAKVASIDCTAFYHQTTAPNNLLRFAFCKSPQDISQTLERLHDGILYKS